MATKLNPGKYDCYKKAAPDEPMFVLLARDKRASSLVAIWSALERGDQHNARVHFKNLLGLVSRLPAEPNPAKADEAFQCAQEMVSWRLKNLP